MTFGDYPFNLYFGLTVGFFATVAIASAIDKFGDAMFRKGIARPFFVGKYRLHHRSFLFKVVPVAYLAIAALILAGFVKIEWDFFWTGIMGTILVAVDCLLLDLTIDYFRHEKGWGILRHEILYIAVPMYAFSAFLRFVI
jgi:hypothetical protein